MRLTKQSKKNLDAADRVDFLLTRYSDQSTGDPLDFGYLVQVTRGDRTAFLHSADDVYRLKDIPACRRFARRHGVERWTI